MLCCGGVFICEETMPRAEKEERVHGIAQRLSSAQGAILTDYRGLTVHDAAELRAALDDVDTRFSVVKNSLTLLAVKEAGLEGLAEYVEGPTAIAFILGDPVAAAKALVDQSRRLQALEIRGGFAEGRVLSAEEVRSLASLDSREVMLAKIAGLGKGQMARTAWMMKALQSKFLALMEALKDKLPPEDAGEAREEPDAPAPPEEEKEDREAPDQATPEEPAEPTEEAEGSTEEVVAQRAGGERASDGVESEDSPRQDEDKEGGG
jgi:large subunit ribosomal protein L10